jgi:hypothetical protein
VRDRLSTGLPETGLRFASQYLDLPYLSEQNRAGRGPDLAKKVEPALNLPPDFKVLKLSRIQEGSSTKGDTPPRELVATLSQNSEAYTLDLERVMLQPGDPWFNPDVPNQTEHAPQVWHLIESLHGAARETPIRRARSHARAPDRTHRRVIQC